MYHRGQGIRKSSRSSKSRSDRIAQSTALTALEQEAQKLASVSSPQDTPIRAPDFDSRERLDSSRTVSKVGSSVSPGGFGFPSQTTLSTKASAPDQRRDLSTPILRLWPSQQVGESQLPQQGGLGTYSEHIFPYAPEYRSPAAAMSAFGQVLQQSPVSHFGHEQDFYSSIYPTSSVDYSTGLFAFHSPESLSLPVQKNPSPIMIPSATPYRESPSLSHGRSVTSSRAPSPTSIQASRTSNQHHVTRTASQPGAAQGDILAYASQAPHSQGLGLVGADIGTSRPEASPFLSPGYFIDEGDNGQTSSNASTVSSDGTSYYSTSLPAQMNPSHQPQYLVPQSYEFGSASPGLASQPTSSAASLFPGHASASNISRHSVGSVDPSHLPIPGSSAIPPETLYHPSSSSSNNIHSAAYPHAPYSSNPIRLLSPSPRPPPQCFEHGCGGRQFSTFSNLLRHQREKSGKASKSVCPSCGGVFTRTTARNGHLRGGKCRGRAGSGGNGNLDSRKSMERTEDRRNSGDGR